MKKRGREAQMKKNIKVKNIVLKNAADVFTPISLMFGFYIIFHGHLIPGGGLQGGVIVAAAVILIYFGYGYEKTQKLFNMEFIRKGWAVGTVLYTSLAIVGLFFFANFCRNIFFDMGRIGELFSSGTIFFANLSLGYIVLTGMGFLILLMLGLLPPEKNDNE
jgi:multicomponent Na+:H+ antiporter subunit B